MVCAICFRFPTNPVMLLCGHVYCRDCVQGSFYSTLEALGLSGCLVCRQTFHDSSFQRVHLAGQDVASSSNLRIQIKGLQNRLAEMQDQVNRQEWTIRVLMNENAILRDQARLQHSGGILSALSLLRRDENLHKGTKPVHVDVARLRTGQPGDAVKPKKNASGNFAKKEDTHDLGMPDLSSLSIASH